MLRGLDPTQKLATTILGGLVLFFLGYVGSSYLHQPQPVEFVQQSVGERAQVIDAGETKEPGTVTVHIVGAVAKPDVYEFPAGTKVKTAIEAAGGASSDADLESINLAANLIDGQQVRVYHKGQAPVVETPTPTPIETPSGGGIVSINTASVSELDTLPGIGPVKAQAIVDYRNKIGGFKSVDELLGVKGIGEKTLANLRPHIKL